MGSCVARAEVAGVTEMVAIGGSPEANVFALRIARTFKSSTCAAVGYDRGCTARDLPWDELDLQIENRDCVAAVGEIGLDFHLRN